MPLNSLKVTSAAVVFRLCNRGNYLFVQVSRMTTSSHVVRLFLIACLFAIGAQSVDLATSQYPFYKANRERNNQLNGNILCSSVAPGRTTVFNDTWTSTDGNADILPPILGEDHFYLLMADNSSNYFIRRYTIDGYPIAAGQYPSRAIPTILQDGSVPLSNTTHSTVVSADLTTELFTPLNNLDSLLRYTSMIPYQGSYLLRPYDSAGAGFISVLNLTNNIANAYWTANISCPESILITMVYVSPSAGDVLVVAADSAAGVMIYVDNSSYSIPTSILNAWAPPFIADGVLHLFLQNSTLVSFNLETRTFVQSVYFGGSNNYFIEAAMMIRGSKALASLKSETEDVIVEVYSQQKILQDKKFYSPPTFSIPDNVVVFATDDQDSNIILLALDWDTWEVKATGLLNVVFASSVSEAVFDENCNVFVTTGDGLGHKLVPLPISDVVPVLDCIDEFNVAYFSYKNNEQSVLRIPYVADRNALSPGNLAPITYFNKGAGDHFPFGRRVQLQNASAEYRWRLEDYLLTFSITPQLACPRNVSLTLTFTASSAFNVTSFVKLVVDTFVAVTGVRDTRVSVLNVSTTNNGAKRMIRQGAPTLEVELEVSAGNSSEPTSAEVVKNLVNNQYTQFGNQVSSSPDAPTDTQLNGIVPKAPVNSQSGVLTPIVPPVASPTNNPPPSETPQSTPVSPTSSGSRVMCLRTLLLAVVMLILSF